MRGGCRGEGGRLVLDLLNRMFGRETASKNVAKERLRVLLVHDRSSVSPALLERLKEDLLRVVSQYMEIDKDSLDVDLKANDAHMALVASIPVKRMKRGWQG